MPKLLGPNGREIGSDEVAAVRQRARAEGLRGAGREPRLAHPNDSASHRGTFLEAWWPSIRSADADWLFDRDTVVARARDTWRNDAVGQSFVQRRVNSAVGFAWRLKPALNARALGITPEQARELRSEISAKFQPYAYGTSFSADAERKKTFGQVLRMAAAHICFDGEALGIVEWAADEPTRYKTRLRMVDPDRLSNPAGQPNTALFRGGVEHTRANVPFRYWIREEHPADLVGTVNSMVWLPWDRYATDDGRPQVLHAFDELRAGSTRGVTRLSAALQDFRAFKKFKAATLENAVINALMVGFVSSQAGPAAVSESLTPEDFESFHANRDRHYEEHPVTLEGAQIPVLPPGDEIKLATTSRDTSGFDAFTVAILRLIAASLGVTYEELTMDFSRTNYSSARAALAVAWQETLAFRGLLEAQIANPFFLAWLEEAIDLGDVVLPPGAPSFYEARDEYAQCQWIGPARGYIDPVKEILAVAARIESQTSTLEAECAEQGRDWEETLEQLAAERHRKIALGLEDTDVAEAQAIQDTKNPAKQAPAPADAAGDPVADPADERPDDANKKQGRANSSVSGGLTARTRRDLIAVALAPEAPAAFEAA